MANTKIKFLQAQNGDCFLLSFTDDKGVPKNILIDGGRDATYYDKSTNKFGDLKREIDLIRSRNEMIDLMILTHIDNDHICGLLKWFEKDNDAYKLIKNVWFNSGKLIAEYLKEPENPDLSLGLKIFRSTVTGVHEAIDFEKYLLEHNLWERKIILKKQELSEFGLSIKILSPDEQQLRKLLKEYREKTGDDAYTTAKESDWKTPLKDFIKEEADPKYKFKQDTSVKNGSSISFILTLGNTNFLFLGDSHPIGISNSLEEMGYTASAPLEVALFKVSHHGSKSNTNHKLISQVKTQNYFFSSDSTGDNHPNKRTLARIASLNPEAVFHFNYAFVKNNIFQPQDFKDFPGIKIKLTAEMEF